MASSSLHPARSDVAALQIEGSDNANSWIRLFAWGACGFVALLVVPILILDVLSRHSPDVWKIADPYLALGGVVYTLVGALIVTRQPRNWLGWLFLVTGIVGHVGSLAASWAVYALETNAAVTGGAWALWISSWISGIAFLPMFPLLLFPTGQIRGRPTLVVTVLTILAALWLEFCLISGTTVPPGFPAIYAHTPNPLFPGKPLGDAALGIVALGVCGILAAALLLNRFRTASGPLRQQYMWIVLDMCWLVLAFAADFVARGIVGHGNQITTPLMNLSIALIPVAVGIAILRHHLFDIELIFSRATSMPC
jgi:hypothetical protein